MYKDKIELEGSCFIDLTSDEKNLYEGGGVGLGIICGLYGGIIGLGAVVFSGNASLNSMWKGYVTGASVGGAIGLVIPVL